MKKTLLTASLAFLFASTALAQDFSLNLFDEVTYYNMYEGPVAEPVPAGMIRTKNSSYSKKLTPEQIASIGNTLTLNVSLSPLCDTYDRIGNVNLVMVPSGATAYSYNDTNIMRIEMGRFITPFMNMLVTNPASVPYTFQVDNITRVLHDISISANYDFWIELEVYGYQGDSSAGAVHDLPNTCPGRNDIYKGSLTLTSTNNPDGNQGDDNYLVPLSYKYELKNYTLNGTDVVGETVKTINFTLDEPVPNAKLYLITSNHGQQEEFIRRDHYVSFDEEQVLMYMPGGLSCVPYRVFNTMPNCIYINCVTGFYRPNTNGAWSWNNWCPGNKIPTRVIDLGNLPAGPHSFRIEVPEAEFLNNNGENGDGYFPMSVYLQGFSTTMDTEDFGSGAFSISPNPVNDIATIASGNVAVKRVSVFNTLGQVVYEGTSSTIDMSGFQSGMYIVKADFENNVSATKKIVKN